MNEKILNDVQDIEDYLATFKGKLVVTCGTFDLFHYGHVEYLQASKELGDELLVLLNSDSSVRFLKGPEKPLNSEVYRARMLASLECVDKVYIFNQSTPIKILDIIKPDYYTKGGDYTLKSLPEKDVVEGNGGKIKLIDFLQPNVTVTKVKFFT